MKTSHIICISIAFLVLSGSVYSQATEISKDDYYGPWRTALTKARGLNRRNISKTQVFTDGKVTSTDEWQYEYDLPDKIRYVHTQTSGTKAWRTEEIDVGKTKYCKKDDAAWQLVTSPCIGGSTGGVPNAISIKYSVEKAKLDNKEVRLYTQYITYKDTFSKNQNSEGLSFYETKYWLNADGLIFREEYVYGLVDPNTVVRATVDTYVYDPKINVNAPTM